MTYESPIWLYMTPLILLIIGGLFALGIGRREKLLSQFAASRLLGKLTEKASKKRTLLKASLVIIAAGLITFSLARPQYGVEQTERTARGLDIIFVLDSSKSMLATDMRPTRLDRAKLAIRDLVRRLESDRIGIVAFAGRAFLQTPPTLDYSAFRESLDSINPSIMTRGGSDIGNALGEASKAFQKENNFKVVILLTDGEDLGGKAIEAAEKAADEGIRVYTIGIGTPEGDYLRIRNEAGKEEFVRDDQGQPVRSQLDESTLIEIANLTGGTYSRLSEQSLATLYDSVLSTLPRQERESELQEIRLERYQWPLALALSLLILDSIIRGRRRQTIHAAIFALAAFCTTPETAHAQEAKDPAKTEIAPLSSDARILYNEATEHLRNSDYERASRLYEKAIQSTNDRILQRDALYNMGHVANQMAEIALQNQDLETATELLKESEALFKSAQELDPTDSSAVEDAELLTARREALEAFIEQQKPPQEQQQQEGDQNEDSEQSESSEDQENQDGEQGEENAQEEETSSEPEDAENSEQSSSSENGQDGQESEATEEQGEEGENGASAQEESTENPMDDIPQPDQTTEDTQGEEDGNPTATEPEEKEDAGQEEPSAVTNGATAPMGEAQETPEMMEARALLDSLRNSEKILPFYEQSDNEGHKRSNRDW